MKVSLEKYKAVKPHTARDLEKEKLLKKKINEVSRAIRRKYLALKLGKAEEDESLNRILKPIVEPLHDIRKNMTVGSIQQTPSSKSMTTPAPSRPVKFLRDEVMGEVFSEDPEEEADLTFDEIKSQYDQLVKYNKPVIDEYLEQFLPLPRYYIEGFFTNNDSYDQNSGARFDLTTNKLFIGNKELQIDDNNVIVDNRPYQGTKGLYELIFMKKPHGYNKTDLKNYKEILDISSAHKRDYNPQGQLKGNKYHKYKNIIKPLFDSKTRSKSYHAPSTSKSGSGMAVYNEKPIEYVYWDDVNELVDRLKLLMASKSAGNTDSHDNEILSIVSELKEIGVIT